MNKDVDIFLENAQYWADEMTYLRTIALGCGLDEILKWKQPCYQFKGKNILIISAFKSHCVMGFFKGVLMADSEKLLTSPGKNTQSVMQLKFDQISLIKKHEKTVANYIFEAIEIEKLGLKVELKKGTDLELNEDLLVFFKSDHKFETAFKALTPGRQRGYNLFFGAAKQSKTRQNRIHKYYDKILDGKGINDCTCGKSKRMPNCDGTHKFL